MPYRPTTAADSTPAAARPKCNTPVFTVLHPFAAETEAQSPLRERRIAGEPRTGAAARGQHRFG
jgi:hypothetical protein